VYPVVDGNVFTTGTIGLLVTAITSYFCYRQSAMSISRRPEAWEDWPSQILIWTWRPSEGDMYCRIRGEVGGTLATVSWGWDLVWASARVPFLSWCLIGQEFEFMVWHYPVVSDVNRYLTSCYMKCSGLDETFVNKQYFIDCLPGNRNMTSSLPWRNVIPDILNYMEMKWFVSFMHDINNLW
jgi:hypothetical protein